MSEKTSPEKTSPERTSTARLERFRVEPWADLLGGLAARSPRLLRRLGDLETRRLAEDLDDIEIVAPIFVCGLARSGTTILLELLAEHEATATHRYRDYPGVLAPVFWERVTRRLYRDAGQPRERAHGDGIAVTADSPEAMEEPLWMAFRPELHDPSCDNRLRRGALANDFADFYRAHIRKLLWLRGGRRYLAKGNYNLARLGALIGLFPDARFVIPLRDPAAHVGSLMRQHALFCAAERRYPAALRYMQRVGHFEFGLDRRPMNLGDREATQQVLAFWREGREVEGWAHYWALVHRHLAEELAGDAALREAVLLVDYEALCARPEAGLRRILSHVGLDLVPSRLSALAGRLRRPAYYRPPFGEAEARLIRGIAAPVAARLRAEADLAS